MPDLRRTRKNLKTALAIMVGVDLLAAVVYFSPLRAGRCSGAMGMPLNSDMASIVLWHARDPQGEDDWLFSAASLSGVPTSSQDPL